MQFSLFDLQIAGVGDITDEEEDDPLEIVIIYDNNTPSVNQPLENYNKLFLQILSEDAEFLAMLKEFGPDREFILHLGDQEIRATVNELGQMVFHITNRSLLDVADWLTLRLYQNGDDPNTLWEYTLDLEVTNVRIEVQDRPIQEYANQLMADEPATLVATTRPEGRKVIWSILSKEEGVLISKFDSDTGEIRLHPESEPDKKIIVRATDSFNPYVFRDFILNCQVCGEQEAGGGKTKLGSIDASFSLGDGNKGESAGKIYIAEDTISTRIYTPSVLKLSSSLLGTAAMKIIKDGATLAYRQILAPQVLVDIQTINEKSYRLDYYKRASVQGISYEYGENGAKNIIYVLKPGAQSYVSYIVDSPGPVTLPGVLGEYAGLRITESRPNEDDVVDIYAWIHDQNIWRLSKANNTAIYEESMIEDGSGNKVVITTTSDGSGNVGEKTETISKEFPWGEEVVSTTLDPDGERLITTSTFYENESEPGYGQLNTRVSPNRNWIRYTYDSEGRKKQVIRSWLDSGTNSTADQAHTISYDYTPVDPQDSAAEKDADTPRTITETIAGTIVSKTLYSYRDLPNGERVITSEQSATATASFSAAENLRTVTTLQEDGNVKNVVSPDDRKTSYTYSSNVDEIIHGTVTSEDGIANKTTKERVTRDRFNNVKRQETQVYTGSGYELTEWSANDLDDLGKIEKTSYSNGTVIEPTSGSCCSTIKTSSDATGVSTSYFYDPLNRLERTERQGPQGTITTSYIYDAVGRQIEQTQTGGGITLSTSSTYDTAGRLEITTDPIGVTTYSYSPDHLTTTVIRPGGATEITTSYPDGKIRSITGTAVIPSFYEYGINPDGSQWTRVTSTSPTSPRWQKSTTDLLGRTIETEQPGYMGTIVSRNYYNDKGQLYKTTTTGQVDQLFLYDELGNQIASGLDLDGNGVLEKTSSDRLSESATQFAKYDDNWWRESSQYTYTEDGSATPTLLSYQRSQLSGLGTASFAISEDIHGNQTTSKTTIDRSTTTVTSSINYPDSAIDSSSISVGGYLMSSTDKTGLTTTFDYDALGRRTSLIDPRTGASISHYNDKGQLDYVENAAGHRTGFGYSPETGRKISQTNPDSTTTYYKYNVRGQLSHSWGSATYPVQSIFNDYGEQVELHTYRADSGWDAPDWPSSGAADITTWNYQEETGILTTKSDAEGNSTSYTYSAVGQLKTRTWARNSGSIVTTYGYDPTTSQMTSIDYSDATPDVSFIYDRLGRQETITDGLGSRSFGYLPTLQLETESMTGLYSATITREYDGSLPGRYNGFTLDNGYQISYGFDSAGRFNAMNWQAGGSSGASGSASYGYLANSNLLETITNSSGGGTAITTYSYEENRNLKTGVNNAHNLNIVSNYTYEYDSMGRRQNVKNDGSAFTAPAFNIYGYNDRSEVTGSNRYQGTDVTDLANPVAEQKRDYLYDAKGNRDTTSLGDGAGKIDIDYTANAVNQYEDVTGGTITNLTYDDDGNLTGYTKDGKALTLTFNGENRLVAIEPASPANGETRSEYRYDFKGRRVSKTLSSWDGSSWQPQDIGFFLYDGWNMVAELDETGSSKAEYIWGLDLSQSLQGAGGVGGLLARVDAVANTSQTYFYDGNGNVGQLMATGGSIAAKYEYDPFGNAIVAEGDLADVNPYRFSTKYLDYESSLYYYGYRFYAPELGRWLNRDPIEENGGVNLYGFVGNEPISKYDLIGLLDAHCKEIDCCGLKDLTSELNKKVKSEIASSRTLYEVRDRLAKDVSHSHTKGLTKIDSWIQDLGEDYTKSKDERNVFGFSGGYRWSSCVKIKCNDVEKCIGADKISHFFQQGFMLNEISSKMKSDELAEGFSLWTEGMYELGDKPTKKGGAVWGWLTSGNFKFYGFNPRPVSSFKNEWGNISVFGKLVSVPSKGDHKANLAGMGFWKDISNCNNYSGFNFNFCSYVKNLEDLVEE